MIAALLAFIVNHAIGVTFEQELVRTFTKLDVIDQTSDPFNISNDFAKDFLTALFELDKLLLQQLQEIGLPLEGKNGAGTNNGSTALAPANTFKSLHYYQKNRPSKKDRGLSTLPPQAPKMFRFTPIMTQCLEMKYLKSALYHSLTPSYTGKTFLFLTCVTWQADLSV